MEGIQAHPRQVDQQHVVPALHARRPHPVVQLLGGVVTDHDRGVRPAARVRPQEIRRQACALVGNPDDLYRRRAQRREPREERAIVFHARAVGRIIDRDRQARMVVVRDGAQVGLPGADPMSATVGLPGRSFGLLPLLLPGPLPALGVTLDDLGGGCQALANLRSLERGVVERVHEEDVGEHVVEVELLPDHRIRSLARRCRGMRGSSPGLRCFSWHDDLLLRPIRVGHCQPAGGTWRPLGAGSICQ